MAEDQDEDEAEVGVAEGVEVEVVVEAAPVKKSRFRGLGSWGPSKKANHGAL